MIGKSIGILVLALGLFAAPAVAVESDWTFEGGDEWGECFGDWCNPEPCMGDWCEPRPCEGDWCDPKDPPVIPTPSAALAGVALISGLAMRRRKK